MSTPKPTDSLNRVFRGGAWYYTSASDVRAAVRDGYGPTYRIVVVGFRTRPAGRVAR